MSVHQLKDGRWFAQRRDKDTGKLKREYFGRGPEAEKAAFERNGELDLRGYKKAVQGHSAFFVDLANEYAAAKMGNNQESTLVKLMYKMDRIILPILGHVRAMNITPKKIDAYIKTRLTESRIAEYTTKTGGMIKRIIPPIKKTTTPFLKKGSSSSASPPIPSKEI